MASDPQDGPTGGESAPPTSTGSRRRMVVGASLLALCIMGIAAVVAVEAKSRSARSLAEFSDDPLITCGGGTPFRASRLRGPRVGDTVDTSSDRRLITKLHEVERMPEISGDVKTWRLVEETPSEAQFIGRASNGYATVVLARHDGSWNLKNLGGCNATTVAQSGLSVANVVLDVHRPVTVDTTQLHLFVQGTDCNGGVDTPTSKIVGPEVHVDAHRIVVTAAVRQSAGFQTCGGVIKTAGVGGPRPDGSEVVVKLDRPVGDRSVLDGTRYPYEPITTWSD